MWTREDCTDDRDECIDDIDDCREARRLTVEDNSLDTPFDVDRGCKCEWRTDFHIDSAVAGVSVGLHRMERRAEVVRDM